MHVLTKLVRKTIVLGLAGLGAYKLWEIVSENMEPARDRAANTKNRLEAVVRKAETDVKDASHDAVETMVDASRIAVAEVAEAVADAALGGSPEQASSQTA